MALNEDIFIKYAEIESINSILELEKKWKCEKIDKDMNPYNPKEIKNAILEQRIIFAEYR